MRTAIIAAAFALTAASGYAQSAQDSQADRPSVSGQTDRTDLGAPRADKQGANQTYNTGETGSQVGQPTTVTPAGNEPKTYNADTRRDANRPIDSYNANADRRTRGTGVATGFIAAGIGLALLGLFVRRRNRHDHRFDSRDDINRPGGTGGAGPGARL